MDLKKLAPWNWFKDEENETESQVAALHVDQGKYSGKLFEPVSMLHRDMNDLFSRFMFGRGMFQGGKVDFVQNLLKPMVDINASDGEYSITIEVPGISQEDVQLSISNNTLIVSGEKQQEKKDLNKNYYRMERSYGKFQRVLSLPEDADQEKIDASFANGLLTVTIPRKAVLKKDIRQIHIK